MFPKDQPQASPVALVELWQHLCGYPIQAGMSVCDGAVHCFGKLLEGHTRFGDHEYIEGQRAQDPCGVGRHGRHPCHGSIEQSGAISGHGNVGNGQNLFDGDLLRSD